MRAHTQFRWGTIDTLPCLVLAKQRLMTAKFDNQQLRPLSAEDLVEKLIHKHREFGASAATDADTRRWLLPDTQPGLIKMFPARAPRVKSPTLLAAGEFTVEVEGMDVYDPVSNTLFPTNKEHIAAWFLDTDYDGRTFCICQAFFPDKNKWAKLAKALGDADVIEEDAFDALSGLTSLPFLCPPRLGKGETWRVAVKVIDPCGNEGLRVLTVKAS